MKLLKSISWKKTYEALIILIAISLPFPRLISSILTIMLIILWAFMYGNTFIKSFKNRSLILFISIYLFSMISLSYSKNLSEGFFSLEKMLSIIVFPFIFINNVSKKLLFRSLTAFSISCLVVSIICLLYGLYKN